MERGDDVLPLYIGDDRTDEDAFGVRRLIPAQPTHPFRLPFFLPLA